jgi:hypothetical protein
MQKRQQKQLSLNRSGLMKKIIFILIALSLNNAHSKTIANCSSPSGYSFYPYIGLATKGDSGWAEDKISGMRATLKLLISHT